MTKYSYFLQVFLQIIFAQNIISSDIFQFKYRDLQKLVDTSDNAETNNQLDHLENILSFDGAFVSISLELIMIGSLYYVHPITLYCSKEFNNLHHVPKSISVLRE